MRALLPVLLFVAAPALAQQGPVDPDLVGTWTLEFVEASPEPPPKDLSVTLTISADGRLTMEMSALDPTGKLRTETEEEQIRTENGQILDGASPVGYTLVGPDDLRISDARLSLRFRRLSD